MSARRTATTIRCAMAFAVAAGTVAALTAPAHAFDGGDCNAGYGSGNVADVDTFKVDTGSTGKVDFGDNFHVGGAPQGTAVACWATNGAAAIGGRLFADSPQRVCVSAKITMYDSTGASGGTTTDSICGNNAANVFVSENEGGYGGTTIQRIRLQLYRGSTLVRTVNHYRGD